MCKSRLAAGPDGRFECTREKTLLAYAEMYLCRAASCHLTHRASDDDHRSVANSRRSIARRSPRTCVAWAAPPWTLLRIRPRVALGLHSTFARATRSLARWQRRGHGAISHGIPCIPPSIAGRRVARHIRLSFPLSAFLPATPSNRTVFITKRRS